MLRLFVAAELEPDFIETCKKIQLFFFRDASTYRPTPAKQIHLTLVFLGDTRKTLIPTISQIIADSFQSLPAVNIKIDEMFALPNPNSARVIALSVEGDNLSTLQQTVFAVRSIFREQKINFDAKPWRPHITIARARRPASFAPRKLESIESVIKNIKIVASSLSAAGPSYQTLFTLKLA